MKTRVFYIFGFVVFATILAMTSCRDQDFDFEEHYPGGEIKKEYEQNWVKQMGAIDPEQDWCMAGDYSVTVNVPGEEDVKVYALNPEGEYRLVGEYFGVSGIQTLKFDAIKGTKDLLVSTSQGFMKTVVDGEVEFEMGTRAVNIGTTNGVIVEYSENDYIKFDNNYINNLVSKSNGWLSGYGSVGEPNYVYVAQSSEIYFYPLYWNTTDPLLGLRYTDEVGIYNAENPNQKVKIFDTKNDKVLQYSTKADGSSWTNCSNNESKTDKAEGGYQSQGIKVTLPEGWRSFGLYIKNAGNVFYSQSSNNGTMPLTNYHWVKCGTVLDDNKNSIICMGDALFAGINQVLFRIVGASTVNINMQSWIIACEDLGDTGDYDFNDLVFKFEKKNVGTNKTAVYELMITPLAAGGTLEAQYGFGGDVHKEIHAAFGKTQKVNGRYFMLNTNAGFGEGEDNVSPLDAGKIIKDYGTTNFNVATELQKFFIRVGGASATMEDSPTPDYEEKNGSYIITAPNKGSAPQMIIVPDGWSWPKEKVSILDAYPEFSTWSSDVSKDDWDLAKAKDGNGDICPFYYQPSTTSSGN